MLIFITSEPFADCTTHLSCARSTRLVVQYQSGGQMSSIRNVYYLVTLLKEEALQRIAFSVALKDTKSRTRIRPYYMRTVQ